MPRKKNTNSRSVWKEECGRGSIARPLSFGYYSMPEKNSPALSE
jgi:hypothetical protein